MSRRSGTCLRLCLVTFAVVSALAVCGPALYWRFNKTLKLGDSKSSCPPCICDCPPPLSLLKIAPDIEVSCCCIMEHPISQQLTNHAITYHSKEYGFPLSGDFDPSPGFTSRTVNWSYVPGMTIGLTNLSITDCGNNDPDLKQEMEKQFVDLLTEELKLQEAVAEEHSRHMNITIGEAKRVASQYQKEVEKCIAATETCEEARERAEASLIRERKVTTLWEQRARQMGW
ncbi:serine carboxypeptidase S28 family protein [Hibiscus syriacus]|uniref:Serine carboxypeptidase S28 family protein n=1 Tax=Hibiscus syriacus TaxID=106335 RepID=A0A6A2YBP1_HIBSY|nr:serine carboxypeptidase S28 family protein [Hibiscus syriacus]